MSTGVATVAYDSYAPNPTEAANSGVSWAAVAAGAFATAALSLILLALGAGAGLSSLSPFSGMSATTVGFGALVYLCITEIISSGVGGYLAGRLRTRWHGTHPHEVFFRDTAHGFLAWALAALAASVVIGPAIAAAAGAPAAAASVDPEAVRKAAAAFSIVSALAMVVGAFIAAVAAAIGGHERDLHP